MHCRLALKVSVLISLLFSSIQVGCRLNARQNVFPRSRLLLFLPFTRVQFNNTKRGIQIPHSTTQRKSCNNSSKDFVLCLHSSCRVSPLLRSVPPSFLMTIYTPLLISYIRPISY